MTALDIYKQTMRAAKLECAGYNIVSSTTNSQMYVASLKLQLAATFQPKERTTVAVARTEP